MQIISLFLLLPLLLLCSCVEKSQGSKTMGQFDAENQEPPVDTLFASFDDTVLLKRACLPEPSQEFMDWKYDDQLKQFYPETIYGFVTDEIYHYLIMTLDSIETKQVVKTDSVWGPYEWTQNFEGSVKYRHIDYLEVGLGGWLLTSCTDKSEFLRAVDPVIKSIPSPHDGNPNYVWKNDSTLYQPESELVGCHYEIRTDSLGHYSLKWYCGC